MEILFVLQGVILALICLFVSHCFLKRRAGLPLPPGPKGLPLIGNLLDTPPEGSVEYQHWLKHKDLYGRISSIHIMGQTMILIHSREAANQILEKASTKTAGRPSLEFCHSMCGYEKGMPNKQYDDNYRLHRRALHQELGTQSKVDQYATTQEAEVHRFLLRQIDYPHDLYNSIELEMGSIAFKTAYGYTVELHKPDPLIRLSRTVLNNFSDSTAPMKYLVDVIPALKHLPESLPGMKFKATAREYRDTLVKSAEIPFRFTKRQIETGVHPSSYLSRLLQLQELDGNKKLKVTEDDMLWTSWIIYTAITDTTASSLRAFILAMILYPEIQQKAQQELERVIGHDRLPCLEDRAQLPYLDAMVKETLRWSPPGPLSLPHRADEDVVYDNYLIPKGSIILASLWWFCHDPETYPEPATFDPERFLHPRNEFDPRSIVFGHGRRQCVGRYFADATLFLNIANLLATFNINKGFDEQGHEITPKFESESGWIHRVKEFPYTVKPRSERHIDLIRNVVDKKAYMEGDSSLLEGF